MLDATDMNNLIVLIKAEVRQQLAPMLTAVKGMGNSVSKLEMNQHTITEELSELQTKDVPKTNERPPKDEH